MKGKTVRFLIFLVTRLLLASTLNGNAELQQVFVNETEITADNVMHAEYFDECYAHVQQGSV